MSTCRCQGCNRSCYPNPSGGFYDYCGSKRCGHTSSTGSSSSNSNSNLCSCNGCGRPRYANPSGGFYDFCGRTCSSRQCGHTSSGSVLLVEDNDQTGMKQQFLSKWLHTKNTPTIVKVLKVHAPSQMHQRFKNYQSAIHTKRGRGCIFGSGSEGNTHRRFHGTKLNCDLGLSSGNYRTCSNSSCVVCSILNNGFLLQHAQSNISFGRFGRGLYFSSCSSKSDDYCRGSSNVYAMFVAHVVVGKGQKLYHDDTTLLRAPNGCDSVLGEVGGSLNYDEVITYDDASALPLYVILYRR